MKSPAIIFILLFALVIGLTSPAHAAIVSGSDRWWISLDANDSYTAIVHYALGSAVFSELPVQTSDEQEGGVWESIGWQAVLLDANGTVVDEDGEMACLYGPRITNLTGEDISNWFIYWMFYEWDDEAEDYDPLWPLYIDTAIFDGPYGSDPLDYWGWRGTSGTSNWEYRDEPYSKDDPEIPEDFFDNPVPEPMTIFLLGLGAAFLRKRR